MMIGQNFIPRLFVIKMTKRKYDFEKLYWFTKENKKNRKML